MNKYVYPAIIVVEGASDKTLLESFLDAQIITTNGSDVPYETIGFLKEAKKLHEIVVLTDPDSPGKGLGTFWIKRFLGFITLTFLKEKLLKKVRLAWPSLTRTPLWRLFLPLI